MKHIKKTYRKFSGDYVLENIETRLADIDLSSLLLRNPYTQFKGGYIITINYEDSMIKNIFLT